MTSPATAPPRGRRRHAAVLAATLAGGLVLGGVGPAGAATSTPVAPAADALAAGPAPAADAPARRGAGVRLTGNGFGHGHGMSQYGAQAQAQAGRGHGRILAFYYPGTSTERVGGAVSVLISADTSSDVVVSRRAGLKVSSPGRVSPRPLTREGATRWRLTPTGGGRDTKVSYYQGRRWHAWRSLPGQAQFSAGGAPITLHLPGGSTRAYRGALRSAAPSADAARDTVNVVPLDTYLRGVVPREVPALWEPQAVQAQAVAARTYAAYERARPLARHYQICDTTACQVYGGATDEHPASDRAVRATRGQVLTADGKPAFTQFSASNGGWTSAGGFSYLPAKADRFDTSYRGWTDTVTYAEMESAFPALGSVRGVQVVERDGHGQWGGRVQRIRIDGSRASTLVSGETFRSYFGLHSSWFVQG